jgi:hypothetical protein
MAGILRIEPAIPDKRNVPVFDPMGVFEQIFGYQCGRAWSSQVFSGFCPAHERGTQSELRGSGERRGRSTRAKAPVARQPLRL